MTGQATVPGVAAEEFRGELEEFLREQLGRDARIVDFDRRGEGWSWETYLVSVQRGDEVTDYAVKREPQDGILGSYDVELEVALLRTARDHIGLPAPAVPFHRSGYPGARDFYVMERVGGIVPMPWDVRSKIPDEEQRRSLGLEIAGIMARLHLADPAGMALPRITKPDDPAHTGRDEAHRWRQVYEQNRTVRIPVVDLALAWLEARADWVSGRLSLVHNDLRTGNVIVRDGHVAAVLDWETAQFSDPAADLAKVNLPTFRGRSKLASQLVPMPEFTACYEEITGWRPTEESLRYWTTMELVKGVIGSIKASKSFEKGTTADVRYLNMSYQMHFALRWLIESYRDGEWGA